MRDIDDRRNDQERDEDPARRLPDRTELGTTLHRELDTLSGLNRDHSIDRRCSGSTQAYKPRPECSFFTISVPSSALERNTQVPAQPNPSGPALSNPPMRAQRQLRNI